MSYMIAVHLGAGPPCSTVKQLIYKQICELACKSAIDMLKNGGSAVDAACEAVRILEDNPHTNAGTGSNLTICGKVECDASVMDGETRNFGSVGAVSNLRNPVLVAKRLLDQQNSGLLTLGRIPPCMLVADGAKLWALTQGFKAVPENTLATAKSQKVHKKHKLKIEELETFKKTRKDSNTPPEDSFFTCDNPATSDLKTCLDTIGAVCLDANGNVASAVSSGGLILKHSGRIGQAAIFGAGCWAENWSFSDSSNGKLFTSDTESSSDREHPSVAVATTGIGENLIKSVFARECAHSLKINEDPHQVLKNVFEKEFLNSPFLKSREEKLAGVLVLKVDRDAIELLVAHTTSSMFVGFCHQGSAKTKVILSPLPPTLPQGTAVQIQGIAVKT